MYDTLLTIAQILALLAAAPARLAGLQPAQLQAFTTHRLGLLAVLEPLPPAAWSRPATVMGAGKPRARTVYTYAQWLANHERSHFRQMEHIAAAVRVAPGQPPISV